MACKAGARAGVSQARKLVEKLLKPADIQINGTRSWDIQVHDDKAYWRVLLFGSIGLGEAYVDGWWDCACLEEFCRRLILAGPGERYENSLLSRLRGKFQMLYNLQNRSRAVRVAHEHYDLGNDLYRTMLDSRMQYTCAYWKDALTLDEAQANKIHLVCRKLNLEPGMRVLELGGGFGGLARVMAEQYGCRVTSYNISREQVAYARDWCKGTAVEFVLADYRDAKGEYDHAVSVGMCEHVGPRNYGVLFKVVSRCLKRGGLFLLHTVGRHLPGGANDPWTDKYIFPHYMTPSPGQLACAAERHLVPEDWHRFAGLEYARTLREWQKNFERGWPSLRTRYGERFYRMWMYYLQMSAGVALTDTRTVWQIVFSKGAIPCGYLCVR
jgi:cyclopropane-fatty-acyl-phospholipid synthase